jgi:hypothetical protein
LSSVKAFRSERPSCAAVTAHFLGRLISLPKDYPHHPVFNMNETCQPANFSSKWKAQRCGSVTALPVDQLLWRNGKTPGLAVASTISTKEVPDFSFKE